MSQDPPDPFTIGVTILRDLRALQLRPGEIDTLLEQARAAALMSGYRAPEGKGQAFSSLMWLAGDHPARTNHMLADAGRTERLT